MKPNYGKSALFALLAAFIVILAGCPEPQPDSPYLLYLTVSSPPTKTVYAVGEPLDLTGLVVIGTYSDNFTKTEAVAPANISGYDSSAEGSKTLTVTINGKTASFTVTVASSSLTSITVSSPPTKTVYAVGEALDLTGLVVTGTYSDGSTKTEAVAPANISGYDSSAEGSKTLTVTINGKTASFTVTVVLPQPDNLIESISELTSYLSNASGGNTANTPVELALDVNLADGGWASALFAINTAGKYVTLDLSLSTMSGAEFDPGTDAGAAKVTSLVLPNGAQSIKEGTYSASSFNAFTNLKEISGTGITAIDSYSYIFENNKVITSVSLSAAASIGSFAFSGCTSLASVDIPSATSIGSFAFSDCTSLASINLPASLTTISGTAFARCTALTSITVDSGNTKFSASGGMLLNKAGATLIAYPSASGSVTLTVTAIDSYAFYYNSKITSVTASSATSIGSYAFYSCDTLESVSLQVATSLGDSSFSFCDKLTLMSLPATPPSLGKNVFSYTKPYSGNSAITITVPSGKAADYTSAWGVLATTVAEGNTGKYGNSHNAITITDGS
ncbi:MAG: leucine-rich repeat protein [Treponema sp.]|jgi:hypothetical protein|nr:leucine-rich repeat protein [Treponema sp.]